MTRHGPTRLVAPGSGERVALVRGFALLVATLIGLYVCYLLVLPFLPALTGALVLVVLSAPFHHRIARKLGHPNLAAAVSVVLLALLVVIPLILLGHQLSAVFLTGVVSAQQQLENGDLQRTVDSNLLFAWLNATVRERVDLSAILTNVAAWLTNLGASIVRESLSNAVTLVLAFYFLFFFLRDHREALRQARMFSPLMESETDYVFGRVSDTIHAIIFGIVITASVQGSLGGVIFWLLGLPNPAFWGFVMALLSILPLLGAFVVWIPAAVYLALSGSWGKAVVLALYGSMVIGSVDNILNPLLAGSRLKLHTIPMFISIVGGILLFGASGLILGPLAVTTTRALVEIWRVRAHGTAL